MSQPLAMQVSTEDGDAEELVELSADLRQTLVSSGLASIVIAPTGTPVSNTLSGERFDPASIGAFLVSIASGAAAAALTELLQNWASDRRCSIRIRIANGEELEINARNRRDVERLLAYIAQFDDGANNSQQ